MIRKLLSILIIACFLSGGTIVYAGESASVVPAVAKTTLAAGSRNVGARLAQKVKNAKEWAAETKPGLEEIKDNREQILQLKEKSNTVYKKAKAKIKQLLQNKDSLTNEQIKELKQAAAKLSADKKLLENSIGDIEAENIKLKEARTGRDLTAYKQAQQNIIKIQESRIGLLKTVIEDIKMIAAM
jgi:chromosome segregation ATPase